MRSAYCPLLRIPCFCLICLLCLHFLGIWPFRQASKRQGLSSCAPRQQLTHLRVCAQATRHTDGIAMGLGLKQVFPLAARKSLVRARQGPRYTIGKECTGTSVPAKPSFPFLLLCLHCFLLYCFKRVDGFGFYFGSKY